MDDLFRDNRLFETIIETIPIPLFLVDGETRILAANVAAEKLTGLTRDRILQKYCGAALRCLHERESLEGCGKTEHCPDCVVRNAVLRAVSGGKTFRVISQFQIMRGDTPLTVDFLVTATPFEQEGKTWAILALDDVSELENLRRLIPICMRCKKVRNDEQYWQTLESFLSRFTNYEFTHGVCPDCMEEYLKELR